MGFNSGFKGLILGYIVPLFIYQWNICLYYPTNTTI